ncbi:MAG: DUF5076 domain-containing protein [Deltaproteobacteria bacterium]|nr:DUF5076 domain-containing protein [Deltaproteobacteria bacterium]
MNKELLIPPKAAASSCRELIRVWAGDGDVHVSLATEVWDERADKELAPARLAPPARICRLPRRRGT